MSQYQKIKEIHIDGGWHCNNEYRARFIFSPHKRREEYEKKFNVHFQSRSCEHGYANVRDYKMCQVKPIKLPPAYKPREDNKQNPLL